MKVRFIKGNELILTQVELLSFFIFKCVQGHIVHIYVLNNGISNAFALDVVRGRSQPFIHLFFSIVSSGLKKGNLCKVFSL